jgi:hypothetical protein
MKFILSHLPWLMLAVGMTLRWGSGPTQAPAPGTVERWLMKLTLRDLFWLVLVVGLLILQGWESLRVRRQRDELRATVRRLESENTDMRAALIVEGYVEQDAFGLPMHPTKNK